MENLWQVNDLDLLINNYALKAELFDQFCLHLMTNLFWKMMQHKKQFFFFFFYNLNYIKSIVIIITLPYQKNTKTKAAKM